MRIQELGSNILYHNINLDVSFRFNKTTKHFFIQSYNPITRERETISNGYDIETYLKCMELQDEYNNFCKTINKNKGA